MLVIIHLRSILYDGIPSYIKEVLHTWCREAVYALHFEGPVLQIAGLISPEMALMRHLVRGYGDLNWR